MVEHRLQPDSAHIPVCGAVNGIAERHIVCRHRLGDRASCAAHVKKPARHLLSCANLGKRPVLLAVEIYLKRLLIRADFHFRAHTIAVTAIPSRRKFQTRSDGFPAVALSSTARKPSLLD